MRAEGAACSGSLPEDRAHSGSFNNDISNLLFCCRDFQSENWDLPCFRCYSPFLSSFPPLDLAGHPHTQGPTALPHHSLSNTSPDQGSPDTGRRAAHEGRCHVHSWLSSETLTPARHADGLYLTKPAFTCRFHLEQVPGQRASSSSSSSGVQCHQHHLVDTVCDNPR